MSPVSLTLLGGLLMGLSSSLHCAVMCGPIASNVVLAFAPANHVRRSQVLMNAQAGRIAGYVLSGATVGAAGAGLYGMFDHTASFLVLRWTAALALAWIGLSIAGAVPSPRFLYRMAGPVAALRGRATKVADSIPVIGAALPGVVWGFLPCSIAYTALFYAMLSGGALSGASVMFGFGLGTLPSVTAVGLGMGGFGYLAQSPATRTAIGLGIMLLAVASLYLPMALPEILCLH